MTKTLPALLALAALAACAPGTAGSGGSAPPAPAAAARPAHDPGMHAVRADTAQPVGRSADIQFMQHMMHHHDQALVMTAMVPQRTTRDDLRRMAQRIDISQRDEMELMRAWLAARGAAVPPSHAGMGGEHAQHAGGAPADPSAAMPGMLTPAQLERLRAARGAEFDRLFLEGMIQHHEGAIEMVAALFRTRGAGQDAEIFRFASDVDADQRAEIARMRQLIAAMRP